MRVKRKFFLTSCNDLMMTVIMTRKFYWLKTRRKGVTAMCMTARERKAKQRSNPQGYSKSRVAGWKSQGIIDASYEKFLAQLAAQNYRCQICHEKIDQSAPYDHAHETGTVRGVLCQDCNKLLGRFENNSAFLLGAASYLQQWQRV